MVLYTLRVKFYSFYNLIKSINQLNLFPSVYLKTQSAFNKVTIRLLIQAIARRRHPQIYAYTDALPPCFYRYLCRPDDVLHTMQAPANERMVWYDLKYDVC